MSWSRDVFSSMVSDISYDDEKMEMTVRWLRGRRSSIFEGVPEDVALEAAKAASVGVYINEELKPFYKHRYA